MPELLFICEDAYAFIEIHRKTHPKQGSPFHATVIATGRLK